MLNRSLSDQAGCVEVSKIDQDIVSPRTEVAVAEGTHDIECPVRRSAELRRVGQQRDAIADFPAVFFRQLHSDQGSRSRLLEGRGMFGCYREGKRRKPILVGTYRDDAQSLR